jgi:leucyl/phenylalanyl-tRNA--protein transferase
MVGMQGAPITGVDEFAGRFAAPQPPVGPTIWQLPSPLEADAHGLVGVGGDLDSTTLLAAYRRGLFPMPFRKRQVGWWSPDPRGIMPRNGMVVSRSLRQSARRFRVSADTAFTDVMRRCGDPRRPHGWINEHFITAYSRLHQLGYAHSVEVWLDDELVGGVYGVRISRFFAGESMFHTATDASKPWLMRTYSGHSTAAASNELYRTNLAKGQTGLSIAFDLPTQTGYDPDHVMARGEVGKVGVPVVHLGHMRTLLAGIPPGAMNTSMTINATAAWLLALYVANAEEQGVPSTALRGTTQNDIVKEYLSRGTYIFPPSPSRG